MDFEAVKWLTSLGVGGVLAGAMFGYYRRDFLSERKGADERREKAERREDRMLGVLERTAVASERLTGAVDTLSEHIKDRRDEHRQLLETMTRLPSLVAHDLRGVIQTAMLDRERKEKS